MKKKKLTILYEDKNLLVVYKESGLLTISTEKEKYNTLFHEVSLYLHKKNQKAFIVHRLDKDTSGLIIFAKDLKSKNILQENWDSVVRKYYAVVLGKLMGFDTIKSYLYEDKTFYTHVSKSNKGLLAITNYNSLKSNDKYSLLDIRILTGRKNQIRVQLNNIGYPILGDKKYGNNRFKRLMLEAYYLNFKHPITKEKIEINLKLNPLFDLN